MNGGGMVAVVGVCLVMTLMSSLKISAELQRFEQPTKGGDGTVRFLVVGDWGRNGLFNQSQVASQVQ